jgi:hypothetical protein
MARISHPNDFDKSVGTIQKRGKDWSSVDSLAVTGWGRLNSLYPDCYYNLNIFFRIRTGVCYLCHESISSNMFCNGPYIAYGNPYKKMVVESNDSHTCQGYAQVDYPTVSFTQSIIGSWVNFGYSYKRGSGFKYFLLSTFNHIQLVYRMSTTNQTDIWSSDSYIELGTYVYRRWQGGYWYEDVQPGDFSFNDV